MRKICMGVVGALAAAAMAVGVLGGAAPAQAAAGQWIDLGWYQYKSTCDADGKKYVNKSKTDAYTDWMCPSDSPGYRLWVFYKY
jgi:hypothetical protein